MNIILEKVDDFPRDLFKPSKYDGARAVICRTPRDKSAAILTDVSVLRKASLRCALREAG